eukprot:TRINITY_DN1243_c0_g1_i1.p1 TRINITY_DN1243_c0_g1~~TRINITY_DN1243_c0_g1_i1.p1  ORF type:complete len:309 (+),score=56.37 TRINITY_DN1243_c0_g1_i1:87-1013(+)
MKLSAETTFLLKKQLKQAVGPLEIGGAAILSTAAFATLFICLACPVRKSDPGLSMLPCAAFVGGAALASALGFVRYRARRPARTFLVCALALWAGIIAGGVMGDKWWHKYAVKTHEYKQMASYSNINPSTEKASSYQDAGVIYFAAGSRVLFSKALGFRNGHTYCVAPIYLDSLIADSANHTKTLSGFVTPKSGTVDFWAVGTDCCGTTGVPFTCHDSTSPYARSGMRVLDANHQDMYKLAVQEWAATTGLAAKTPMFLEWVIDPLAEEDKFSSQAGNVIPLYAFVYLLAAIFVSYVLHIALRHFKVL